MGRIHIITDSTCDLTKEEVAQHGIHIVPLTIQIDGQTYTDGVDLEPQSFLGLMKNAKNLPKSSQPAPGKFKELYDELGKDGDRIISIHMTGGMSGTVESARQAAQMTDADVTVIDSRFIAIGLAIQLREAIRMRDEGATVEEIVARLDKVRDNTYLYVIVDTLENLIKGGRIGKGKGFIGSLLNIKVIANLEGGVYNPVSKVRSHKQVVNYLFKQFQEDTAGKTVKAVGISHADGLLTMGNPLKALIEETGFNDVEIAFTSPIISTHTGPGAIGFIYFAE
ncbi:MAG TPA: DegV family protein [Lysinibacillus sp.]|uniref:DegV family protein n=1 Tax=Lysinibacillus fusiformis TaxID=28031 RepID=A0A2I0UZ26_9BACI|nr:MULTISPECIES: DegV family protein [Lysinibacillus]HBT70858.1 DegV family protein [Lysinibacillus sp.]KUF37499.1 fatty acid-binding protein DegV [Lysinibacillus sp. F5]MEE3806667.1 DegV family protein [Lysinibacillus fusiformis]PKU51321.1 DegV family protein [Lysinibacillus fusiformis]WCH49763.1 DegV family protein [Lysinibacillus sp. OF-1]